MIWVTGTRATDGGRDQINMKCVERMWTHTNDQGDQYTVMQFRTGGKISYREPLDYFINEAKLPSVEVSWPDEA